MFRQGFLQDFLDAFGCFLDTWEALNGFGTRGFVRPLNRHNRHRHTVTSTVNRQRLTSNNNDTPHTGDTHNDTPHNVNSDHTNNVNNDNTINHNRDPTRYPPTTC
jgi:hypothetical protein